MYTESSSALHSRALLPRILALGLLLLPRLAGQAVYVPNYATSNVSGFIADPSTGALSAASGLPLKTGTSPITAFIHPGGRFLYVLSFGSQDITLYSISAPSGALNVSPCLRCEAYSPSGMTIDPSGQFLFVTSGDLASITTYAVDAFTGGLQKISAVAVPAAAMPVCPAVDPSGRYLYVAYSKSSQVGAFTIGGGSLAPVPGSPLPTGSGPSSVAVSRNAVFVANQYSGDVSVYQIGAGGALTAAGIPVPVGGNPTSIAVDPTGNYVYVANQTQLVALNTTPNGPYPLTYLRAYNAGTSPSFVAVEPNGTFVYVVNAVSNDVSAFTISAGGTLLTGGSASMTGTAGSRILAVGHIGHPTSIALLPGYPAPGSGSTFGTPVTVKGVVRDRSNAPAVPTGFVTASVNGSVALDQSGAFQLVFDGSTQYLDVGSNLVKIDYSPGAGFEAQLPVRFLYTVTPATPVFNVTASANAISVSSTQIGGRFPDGSLTFAIDGVSSGNAVNLIKGAAALSPSLSAGDHSVSVSYSGDKYFLPIKTNLVLFHVKRITSISLTANSTSLIYGENLMLTATIAAAGAAVNGSADIFLDGAKLNSTPLPVTANQANFGPFSPPVGVHSIVAAFSGDADNLPSASSALTVAVSRAVARVGAPLISGTAISVGVSGVSGGAVPTGTVTLIDGAASIATATLANGAAAFSVKALNAGIHSLTATYSGDTNYASALSPTSSVDVAKATPQLSLGVSPSGVVSGQSVGLIATVRGPLPATGVIDFYGDGAKLNPNPLPLNGGDAQFSFVANGAGVHKFSAVYGGDANNNAVHGADVAFTVAPAPTTTNLWTSSETTLSSRVAAVSPATGTPTGRVTFSDGASLLGSADLSSGIANLTIPKLAAGRHTITATYSGARDFEVSASAALSLVVNRASTTTTLSVSQTHTATTFTAFVNAPIDSIPSGSVEFLVDGARLGTASLTGRSNRTASATLTTSAVSGTVTAAYSGDGNFEPSSSAPAKLVAVAKAEPAMTMNVSPATTFAGQRFTCTVNLTQQDGAPHTGTVQLYDGSNLLSTVSAAAQTVFTPALDAGNHNLIASYSGDVNYYSSSATYSLSVSRNPSVIVVNAPTASAVFGERLSITAKLASGSGKVDFVEGSFVVATASVTEGTATSVLPVLEPGTHGIVAVYAGDRNWAPARSNPVAITVVKAATAIQIGASASGGQTNLWASLSVQAPGSGTPTGAIDFVDGLSGKVLASRGFVDSGVSLITPPGIESKTIIAVYRGDGGFLPSSSAPMTGFAVVNAASYESTALAPDELATIFVAPGTLPESLGAVRVTVTDSAGSRLEAPLLYVSPSQVTFLVPAGTQRGPAVVTLSAANGGSVSAVLHVVSAAPGLFAADATGRGWAAAQVVRVHPDGTQEPPENTAAFDPVGRTWIAAPIRAAENGDELYLILYATGIRHNTESLSVRIEGPAGTLEYAGPQPTFAGLDQINVRLPASLSSDLVDVAISVVGAESNHVWIAMQGASTAK